MPYAHPYFARVDPGGRGDVATTTGDDLIASVLALPGVRLVPDFVRITENSGVALLPEDSTLSRDFSSDAMRVFWRIVFDCRLHNRIRACADPLDARRLTSMLSRDGKLYTRYHVDGSPLERTESVSFYGMALPFLLIHSPPAARALEIEGRSRSAINDALRQDSRYYDANWLWFGFALADGSLIAPTSLPGS